MLQQINASAGSGKTYTLTRQFLTLLKEAAEETGQGTCGIARNEGDPHSWPEILAVTFTNKAAAEMQERVIRSLKERALGIGETNPASDWDPTTAARWVAILLRRFSSLNIRTIDSLLNMLVRLSALDLGLPPDFEPVFDETTLFDPLFDQLLARAEAGGPEREILTDACQSILLHTNMKGFVPGNALRNRLYSLLKLAITGNRLPETDPQALRAWLVDMHTSLIDAAHTIGKLIQEEGLDPMSNFTKFLAKCTESSPFANKLPPATYAQKYSIDDCLKKNSKGKASDSIHTAYHDLAQSYAQVATTGKLLKKALELAPFVALAGPMAEAVDAQQVNEGLVPAALWPLYARHMLRGVTGVSEAFCRMGSRLTHLLIDEFQDTSREQWGAIQPLAIESLSKAGSLVYVGDIKQAIYGWRGGDSALFEHILDDDEICAIEPAPKRTSLPFNWRSSRTIIEFNNTVFTQLADDRLAMQLAKEFIGDAPDNILEETAKDIVHGFAGARQEVPAHKMESGGMVRLYDVYAKQTEELFSLVKEKMADLFKNDLATRRNHSDIAVLVRKNSEAALIAGWLVEWGFPVITENSLRLAEHPIIQQTVALLSFIDYPLDDLAFWEFISGKELFGTLTGISSTELTDWLTQPRKGRLFSTFRERWPKEWQAWIAPFYSQSGLMSAYDIIREVFSRFQLLKRHPRETLFLRRFLEVAYAAEEKGIHSLAAFLDFWKETGGEEKVPMPENVDAVRVMTMHKSKGLEFPVVVIPFHHHTLSPRPDPEPYSIDGKELILPRSKEMGEPYYRALAHDAREHLHLLYVAWTRPVEELHAFITSTQFSESHSPVLATLRKVLQPVGFGIAEEGTLTAKEEEDCRTITIGQPPTTTAFAQGKAEITTPQISSLPPAEAEDWKPMDWLPRLKIFRNPLQEVTFSERRRGTLVHTCLEHLHLTGDVVTDVRRAVRHGLKTSPLPVPDHDAVTQEFTSLLLWLASLPQFAHWAQYGTPEQAILDEQGKQHRTDLFVDDGTQLTVVEYKTGDPSPAHKQQVRRYLELLTAMPSYHDRTISGQIVYLDHQDIVEVHV